MKAKAYRLLVVAHPDDETIFFAGALQRKKSVPWKVVCVTDGNADGRGLERAEEFRRATKLLGVKEIEHWEFRDKFPDRLPVNEIAERLRAFPMPKEIFTHGPLGEYGHPHHQDVSLAVHRAFPRSPIYSPSFNADAEIVVKMSPSEFKKKTKAFFDIYRKETASFLNVLPNGNVESFCRFRNREVESLVSFLRGESETVDEKSLRRHRWMMPVMDGLREKFKMRLF